MSVWAFSWLLFDMEGPSPWWAERSHAGWVGLRCITKLAKQANRQCPSVVSGFSSYLSSCPCFPWWWTTPLSWKWTLSSHKLVLIIVLLHRKQTRMARQWKTLPFICGRAYFMLARGLACWSYFSGCLMTGCLVLCSHWSVWWFPRSKWLLATNNHLL